MSLAIWESKSWMYAHASEAITKNYVSRKVEIIFSDTLSYIIYFQTIWNQNIYFTQNSNEIIYFEIHHTLPLPPEKSNGTSLNITHQSVLDVLCNSVRQSLGEWGEYLIVVTQRNFKSIYSNIKSFLHISMKVPTFNVESKNISMLILNELRV